MFVVLGFGSTHAALDAEEILLGAGVNVVPIPAPASLSANCGIALRIQPNAEARARELLSIAQLEPTSLSEIEDF